jgi:hypothetical protein
MTPLLWIAVAVLTDGVVIAAALAVVRHFRAAP